MSALDEPKRALIGIGPSRIPGKIMAVGIRNLTRTVSHDENFAVVMSDAMHLSEDEARDMIAILERGIERSQSSWFGYDGEGIE